MAYLKPQSPLKHKDGDYFYPLTTTDQVITADGSRLNILNYMSVDNESAIDGEPTPINADTLGGYPADAYLKKGDPVAGGGTTQCNGDIRIDMSTSNQAEPNPINADTLSGKKEDELSVANANALGGKFESELSVANAVNANTLGGYDADNFVKQDELATAIDTVINAINLGALSSMVESTDYPGCYYHEIDGATEWLNPPMVLGTEYRTVERFKNKVVYAKTINFGTLPNNTTKTVSTGLSKNCEIREFSFFVKGTNPDDGVYVSPVTDYGAPLTVWLSHNLSKITVHCDGDASAETGYAYIRYTK